MKSPLCNTHGCLSLPLPLSLSLSLCLFLCFPFFCFWHSKTYTEWGKKRNATKSNATINKIELNPSPMSVLVNVTQLAVFGNQRKIKTLNLFLRFNRLRIRIKLKSGRQPLQPVRKPTVRYTASNMIQICI